LSFPAIAAGIVLRVHDSGFVITQPNVRNAALGIIRRTDGYGASAIARVWLDK